jgi:Bax protein
VSSNQRYPAIVAFMLLSILVGCSRGPVFEVRTIETQIDSLEHVVPLRDSLVVPILYSNVSGFERLSLAASKEKFVALMLPAILVAKHEREMDRLRLQQLLEKDRWSVVDSIRYRHIMARYRAKNNDEAMLRMQTLPNSVVLAQAAIETGWGTSRFFVEARNVFGIWSFSDRDKRIEARAVRGNTKVYLRAYTNLVGSVRDYFDVLGTSNAFRGLRIVNETTDDPFILIPYLRNYSEKKGTYTRLVKKMITQNDLTRYDSYQIDPQYLETAE